MTEQLYRDVKGLVPERWWGRLIWLVLAGWAAFSLWYVPHLWSTIGDYEQVDRIAARLSPDKAPDERLQALVDQVDRLLDQEKEGQRAASKGRRLCASTTNSTLRPTLWLGSPVARVSH